MKIHSTIIFLIFLLGSVSIFASSNLPEFNKVSAEYYDWKKKTDNNVHLSLEWNNRFVNALWTDWSKGDRPLVSKDLESLFNNYNSDKNNVSNLPRVRIEIISMIGNSIRGCDTNFDVKILREELLKYHAPDDIVLLVPYLRALGLVGNSDDVPYLVSVIQTQYPGLAERAVESLASIKGENITRILNDLSNSNLRSNLLDVVSRKLRSINQMPVEYSSNCNEL